MTHAIWREQEKFRFIIEEGRTGRIISRDLPVQNPQILRRLSGPAMIEFDLDPQDPNVMDHDTGKPMLLKPWGHWCHVEYTYRGERKIWVSGIFQPSEVDPATGMLHARFEGFSGYPKKIPWLENWNPIAVDPFEIVDRIWTHIQSYENGDLGVVPYTLNIDGVTKDTPPESGTLMLPGFSFDGSIFVNDFFAIFIRAVDFTDCGDYIEKLARDIPFDYFEETEWNEDGTALNKYLQLAYPYGGAVQSNLSFRLNENVFQAKSRIESEIEWTSDIIIRGWFPGKVYSSELSNADDSRYRRTILEEDAQINSVERSQAWAHRQLSRRQFPHYWESLIANMYHPNAPFGSYDVGDLILIRGTMPWVGEVEQAHKIIAMAVNPADNTCELTLRAEGAFNYDPIYFEGVDPNLLSNPSFTTNMNGWTQNEGVWTRDPLVGSTNLGAVKVAANGTFKELQLTTGIAVSPGDKFRFTAMAYYDGAVSQEDSAPIRITATGYTSEGNMLVKPLFGVIVEPAGTALEWESMGATWKIPANVATVKVELQITEAISSGYVWFDDLYVSSWE